MGALTLTVTETAAELGVSRGFLYRYLRSGELPSLRVGGRRLVLVTDLKAFLLARRDQDQQLKGT